MHATAVGIVVRWLVGCGRMVVAYRSIAAIVRLSIQLSWWFAWVNFRNEDGKVYAHSGGGPEWEGDFQRRR